MFNELLIVINKFSLMFLSCEKNSKSEDKYESLKIKSCFFSSGLKLPTQSAGIGLQVRSRALNEHNAAQLTTFDGKGVT